MFRKFVALILCSLILTGCSTLSITKGANRTPKVNVVKNQETTSAQTKTIPEKPKNLNQELVTWEGDIEHIFFHPLIIEPSKAFDGSYREKGFDNWMITKDELQKILPALYKKNFVLVSPYEAFVEKDGRWQQNWDLKIPKGKKPLIITIDDLSYNKVYEGHGYAHRLVLDNSGNVTAQVKDGEKTYTDRENETATMINAFCEKHPDFSFNNAKGILALTGYEGILGYRTQKGSPNRAEEVKAVKPIIEQLKKDGWVFASHSYSHWNFETMSHDEVLKDTDLWKEEVEPLVGKTSVYVLPYGNMPKEKNEADRMKILTDVGFHMIFAVGHESFIAPNKSHPSYVVQDRRAIDGFSMRIKGRLEDLFHVKDVFSESRKANPVGNDDEV